MGSSRIKTASALGASSVGLAASWSHWRKLSRRRRSAAFACRRHSEIPEA